jgi:hypothetical protein
MCVSTDLLTDIGRYLSVKNGIFMPNSKFVSYMNRVYSKVMAEQLGTDYSTIFISEGYPQSNLHDQRH